MSVRVASDPGITINGKAVRYEGIGAVRDGMSIEDVAKKTADNNLDEMVLSVDKGDGETERVIIYGDKLDFSFRGDGKPPVVQVNGVNARILHYDNEATSFLEGGKMGLFKGYQEAFDTLASSGKRIIGTIALGGGAMLVGGTAWAAVVRGGADMVRIAIMKVAPAVGKGALVLAGAATVAIGLAGAVSGAFGAAGKKPKTETIAAVVDEGRRQRPARRPEADKPASDKPAAEQPAANRPHRAPALNVLKV